MTRHFLSLFDATREEIETWLGRSVQFKAWRREGRSHTPLTGKILALLFEKSSTRTRVSFEVAMSRLGGQSITLTSQTSQLGRGESYEDTARVLSGYVDGIVMRTFAQTHLERLAKGSTIPVINGLSNLLHPCQLLADLMTVQENKGRLDRLHIVWLGDGNNMANSWIEAAILFGFRLTLACPKGFDPAGLLLKKIQSERLDRIQLVRDPQAACEGADVINTDTWVSMGQEGKGEEKKKRLFQPYQLNAALLSKAKPDAIVLHCLPAHRGEEITDDVMDGPQSQVWDQAENRLYVQMALLESLLS